MGLTGSAQGEKGEFGKLGALRLATAHIAHVVPFAPRERRWRDGDQDLVAAVSPTLALKLLKRTPIATKDSQA